MRMTRRRERQADPFASADRVRPVFARLKARFPPLSPLKEKDTVKVAPAAGHVERYSATDTRRGRPSRWPREDLARVGRTLTEMRRRETSGKMSLASFVDPYLRLLDFPADLIEALNGGSVNLFEAEQFARIKPGRLEMSPAEARRKRAEILLAHLKRHASGERLRRRVNELLAPVQPEGIPTTLAGDALEGYESLEDFDPHDSTHLFWKEIKQLGFAFRDIRREDLTDELIEGCYAPHSPCGLS